MSKWVKVELEKPEVDVVVFGLTDIGYPAIVFLNADGSFTDVSDGEITGSNIVWWMPIVQPA